MDSLKGGLFHFELQEYLFRSADLETTVYAYLYVWWTTRYDRSWLNFFFQTFVHHSEVGTRCHRPSRPLKYTNHMYQIKRHSKCTYVHTYNDMAHTYVLPNLQTRDICRMAGYKFHFPADICPFHGRLATWSMLGYSRSSVGSTLFLYHSYRPQDRPSTFSSSMVGKRRIFVCVLWCFQGLLQK